MSTLIRDEGDTHVECDMDYSKYVINGINYVPCIIRINELGKVMDILMSYVRGDHVLSQLMINAVGDELRIEMPITIMSSGKSLGEVINELIYLIIGIRHCLHSIEVKH
ncbi:hypothetical protein [Vulcanisaeta souniana]|uniref:Uncharacterized protein n=1 Tax=Vulcanisaeta souniana JCM 11219 TaxID=1293586 RepID=A0A830E0T6_9CREN|nr:hypothetical protein [Vulcanisaeta souniana]BDR91671.1 hypothetical protein Vsou_07640 [Vulcanisaeta souniana JCM 11219]GGI71427.1 hypothetical protein GCM10007112_05320 [Vulcanisaeta souniana JCM 11219]